MAYYNGNPVRLAANAVTVEGGAAAEDAVLYTPQTLTTEQKAQARANIGAAQWVPSPIIDTELDVTSNNPVANSAVVRGLGQLGDRLAVVEAGGKIVEKEIGGDVIVLDKEESLLELRVPTTDDVKVSISGANLWDEIVERGYISPDTGTIGASDKYWRSANYIPVLPNVTYYLHAPAGSFTSLVFFDSNQAFVKGWAGDSIPYNRTFTTNKTDEAHKDIAYVMFQLTQTYSLEYEKGDICINVAHEDINGTYETYVSNNVVTVTGGSRADIEMLSPYTVFAAPPGTGMSVVVERVVYGDTETEAVLYTPQSLTPEQKALARANIGVDTLMQEVGESFAAVADDFEDVHRDVSSLEGRVADLEQAATGEFEDKTIRGSVVILDSEKTFKKLEVPSTENVYVSGANVWNGQYEFGWFGGDGTPHGGGGKYLKPLDYIRVLPNTEYYLHAPGQNFTLYFYDSTETPLPSTVDGWSQAATNKTVFKAPEGAAYMMFKRAEMDPNDYTGNICICWNNAQLIEDAIGTYDGSAVITGVGATLVSVTGSTSNIETFDGYTVLAAENGVTMTVTVSVPAGSDDTMDAAVLYTPQTLTDEQKAQARANIGSYGVPDFVKAEADNVADAVLDVRDDNCFVFAAASDFHTTGKDASATSVLHCAQGITEINDITRLDLVALFGDVESGNLGNDNLDDDSDADGKGSMKYMRKCFADVRKSAPVLQLQGNHDQLSSDSFAVAKQKYYAYIGANNIGTVVDPDNKFRNYGYMDFPDHKIRVIYANDVDVADEEQKTAYSNYYTVKQVEWLRDNAFNLSDKGDDEANWGVILFTHQPLTYYATLTEFRTLVEGFAGHKSGSMEIDHERVSGKAEDEAVKVPFNFTPEVVEIDGKPIQPINAKAEFIAHFHGHLHNFRVDTFDTNSVDADGNPIKVVSITIPNACIHRNNEYGTKDKDPVAVWGDPAQEAGENVVESGLGLQYKYDKETLSVDNPVQDTAFNVVVVNRATRTIKCFNYGAGRDRTVTY